MAKILLVNEILYSNGGSYAEAVTNVKAHARKHRVLMREQKDMWVECFDCGADMKDDESACPYAEHHVAREAS